MTLKVLKTKLVTDYGLMLMDAKWGVLDSVYTGYSAKNPDHNFVVIVESSIVTFLMVHSRNVKASVTWKIENIRSIDAVIKTLLRPQPFV